MSRTSCEHVPFQVDLCDSKAQMFRHILFPECLELLMSIFVQKDFCGGKAQICRCFTFGGNDVPCMSISLCRRIFMVAKCEYVDVSVFGGSLTSYEHFPPRELVYGNKAQTFRCLVFSKSNSCEADSASVSSWTCR